MKNKLVNAGVLGVEKWQRELDRYEDGSDQTADVLAQAGFALDFTALGLAVEMNPMGDVGPDLLLPKTATYVEVLRLRPRDTDLPKRVEGDAFPEYGAENASDTLGTRIDDKFQQSQNLPNGSSYLVAIRSDSDSFEDIEIEEAVSDMMREAASGGPTRPWLGGVLFNDGQIRVRDATGWMLWENANADQPLHIAVKNSLDARPI